MFINIMYVFFFVIFVASSAPIPDWYSKQDFFDSQTLGVQSPDQNCVVQYNGSLLIFRPQILDPTTVNITLPQTIVAPIFTADGQSLYVVTYQNETGTLYEFQIKDGNISEGNINYGKFKSTEYLGGGVSLSSQNKLAIQSGQYNVLVLQISKQTKSFTIDTIQFKGKLVGIHWHPIENEMLLFGQIGDDGRSDVGGLFGFYNTSSKEINSINTMNTRWIGMMKNGSILFQSWQYFDMDKLMPAGQFHIYFYENGTGSLIERKNFNASGIRFSNDGKIFGFYWSDWNYTGNSGFGIFKEKTKNSYFFKNDANIGKQKDQNGLGLIYFTNFQTVYQAYYQIGSYYNFYKLHGMSPDGNQIYIHDSSNEDSRYSRCNDGTYPSNGECLNCSQSCKTCHKSSIQCRTCRNGSYYDNEKCFPCNQRFQGCLSCYTSKCLICDQRALFNHYPMQGQCKCYFNYYYDTDEMICKKCAQVIPGCENCQSKTKCTSCDQRSNFYLDLSTNSCACRQKYALVNGVCEQDNGLFDLQPWQYSLIIGGAIILIILCVVCICKKIKSKKLRFIPFTSQNNQVKIDSSSLITPTTEENLNKIEQINPYSK